MNEELLKRKFGEVKQRFNHVPLKNCNFSSEIPTAAISMKSFNTSVNPKFIKKITESELTAEDSLDGVLEHEVGHFAYHPFSVERVLAESIKAKEFNNGESIRQFYDDVNNNLRLIVKNDSSKIPDIYKALVPNTNLEKVLSRFYESQTGKDFGSKELNEDLEEYVSKLERINFLNATPNGRIEFVKLSERRNLEDMKRFYNIIKPLFEENQEQQYPSASPSIGDFNEKDLRKGLKKLVQDGVIDKKEVKEFTEEHGHKFESGSLPGGSFSNNPEEFADRFFYESLAQKQRIKLKKTPIIRSDGTYPTSLDKFSFSDSLEDFDPFSSMGTKILPGVSNKVVREKIDSHGHLEKTPDLVLLMDDSGSMPNPKEETSYAIVSGLVIAREYTKNKSPVSVVLFSDRTKPFEESADYNLIAEHLLTYGNGSDTRVDLKNVPVKIGADYILVTDGQIRNYNDVIGYFNKNANRAYVVTIGEDNETSMNGKVKHMYVNDEKDIGKIVLDDIHRGNSR